MYKIYEHGAGVKAGALQNLKGYDLSNDLVKQHFQLRHGNEIPHERAMISFRADS
ncbi:MAG TPA: hypothetical protein VEY71_01945 [Chitinophagales bacterium]|nr:hypothetical protein [Chitinophagales bacterium]